MGNRPYCLIYTWNHLSHNIYVMTFTRPLRLSDWSTGEQSEKDTEILKSSEGIDRWGFLELSKQGMPRAQTSVLTSFSAELWEGGLLSRWRKDSKHFKRKGSNRSIVLWKLWENNRSEQQCQMLLKPHRNDHKITFPIRGKETRKLKHQK